MPELEQFLRHCRAMSTAEHKPECRRADHLARCWGIREAWTHPDPACTGCVTDADRALWARLADEVEAYLSHEEEGALFS